MAKWAMALPRFFRCSRLPATTVPARYPEFGPQAVWCPWHWHLKALVLLEHGLRGPGVQAGREGRGDRGHGPCSLERQQHSYTKTTHVRRAPVRTAQPSERHHE